MIDVICMLISGDEGRVMVMEFKAKSLLKPTFVWQKGDEIVAESNRYKIVTKETEASNKNKS